jgi:hypothetical protein
MSKARVSWIISDECRVITDGGSISLNAYTDDSIVIDVHLGEQEDVIAFDLDKAYALRLRDWLLENYPIAEYPYP